jgi:hypothetical protein
MSKESTVLSRMQRCHQQTGYAVVGFVAKVEWHPNLCLCVSFSSQCSPCIDGGGGNQTFSSLLSRLHASLHLLATLQLFGLLFLPFFELVCHRLIQPSHTPVERGKFPVCISSLRFRFSFREYFRWRLRGNATMVGHYLFKHCNLPIQCGQRGL